MYSKNVDLISLKSSYVDRAIDTVFHIHQTFDQPGDILVFLTGSFVIDRACQVTKALEKTRPLKSQTNRMIHTLDVYGIYSSLETLDQKAVFQSTPKGHRKVVFATNIAQTSITIPGIVYVVDSGFVKQKMYDPQSHMDALLVVPISKAAATQRAGRAGRTMPGKAYRLYSIEMYQTHFPEDTVPEIQRVSLLDTMLTLKALRIHDVLGFQFLDPPDSEQVTSALHQLYWLQALTDQGQITKLGQTLTSLPLSPFLARALWAACHEFQCSQEMVLVCAMLSVEPIYLEIRDPEMFKQIQKRRAVFFHPTGDHLTLLQIYVRWEATNYSKQWCRDHYFQYRALIRARSIKQQLQSVLSKKGIAMTSVYDPKTKSIDASPLIQSFCTAFFCHLAKKHATQPVFYQYSPANESNLADTSLLSLSVQPTSALVDPIARDLVDWVFYHDVVYTTRAQMQYVSKIWKFKWVQPYLDRLKRGKTLSLSGEPTSSSSSSPETNMNSSKTIDATIDPTPVASPQKEFTLEFDVEKEERKRKIEAARERALKRARRI